MKIRCSLLSFHLEKVCSGRTFERIEVGGDHVREARVSEEKMKTLLVWIFVLCLFDAVVTDLGIQAGYIRELNPLMKEVYHWSRIFFYGCKLFLPLLLLWIYPRLEHRKMVNGGVMLCLAAYVAVTVYHVSWMLIVLKGTFD